MKIHEARQIAAIHHGRAVQRPGSVALAAVTMAEVLDQIEQACRNYGDYDADGLLHDISDILDGKRQ